VVWKVHQVFLDRLDTKEIVAKTAILDTPDNQAPKVIVDSLAVTERKAIRDHQVQLEADHSQMDHQDHRASLACLDCLAHQALMDSLDDQAMLDQRDFLADLADLDYQDEKEHLDPEEIRAMQAILAYLAKEALLALVAAQDQRANLASAEHLASAFPVHLARMVYLDVTAYLA